MKTYNEMADNVFRRRDEYISERKKIIKLSASFACMALILFAGFGLWQRGKVENKPISNTDTTNEQTLADSVVVGEKDYYEPVKNTPYINGVCIPLDGEDWNCNGQKLKMIESFDGGISSAIACYASPQNGDQFFSIPLHAAFDAYGETDEETGEKIVYRVIVRIFEDGKMIMGKENLLKIAEKLGKMGYISAIEIPNNSDDLAVLTLHVTEEDLKNFPEDKEYGYFFFLFKEQDGMGESGAAEQP